MNLITTRRTTPTPWMLTALVLGVLLTPQWAQAQTPADASASPVGLWRTIDDDTHQERSLVRITEAQGVLTGKIEKLADPGKQEAICDQCQDHRKNQRILGMTIIENVRPAKDGAIWEGGQILDPNNGKTYRLRLTPQEQGRSLQVRGYLGPFYRTQVWQRAD